MKKASLLSALTLLFWIGAHARTDSGVKILGTGQKAGQSTTAVETPELKEAAQQTTAAVGFYREGKFEAALSSAKRALELREKVLPKEHALIGVSLNNVGQIYYARENYAEALKIFLRLQAAYEKTLPSGHENHATVLQTLSAIYFYLGKDSEAEKSYLHLLALRETAHGADHPHVAQALFNLASFYQFRGKEKQAGQFYARAIALWEKKKEPGMGQTQYVTALERYACILRNSDKEAEAEELTTRASEVIVGQMDSILAKPISGGVLNGKALSKPSPSYPIEARDQRQSGTVAVNVLVDETGRVLQACAVSGPRLLRAASERAAYAARFSPTLLAGTPVKVRGIITYNYVLR